MRLSHEFFARIAFFKDIQDVRRVAMKKNCGGAVTVVSMLLTLSVNAAGGDAA